MGCQSDNVSPHAEHIITDLLMTQMAMQGRNREDVVYDDLYMQCMVTYTCSG